MALNPTSPIKISKGRVKVDEENEFDFEHLVDSSFAYRLLGRANVLIPN